MKKILPLISLLLLCNLTAFAEMISSEVCEIQCTSGSSKPWFSLETDDNGDLLFSIAGDATEVGLRFRGNPFKRDDTQFTVDGAAASGYFDLDASDYTTSAQLVIRVPLLSEVSVPANAKINLVCTLEWWSSLNNNAYTSKTFPEYTYGTICCLSGKELKATVSDIRKTIATVDVNNRCLVMEGSEYEYRLGYKESTESSYTYIEGFQSTYNLSGLTMGTAYDISFEAATPSFAAPTSSYSATTSLTTKDNQSTACDIEIESSEGVEETGVKSVGEFSLVTNGVTGNMELLIDGDETDYQFRAAPGLSEFLVNGGPSTDYFDTPYLSSDKTIVIIPLKSGSPITDNDLVTFSGTLAWKSSVYTNSWRMNQSFSTLYNTSCCVEGQQLTATVADVQTNSAQISLADNCIVGQSYQYRLRYKLSSAAEYQTLYAEGYARPEGGVYILSSLLSDETYDAIAEAAYPDFTNPEKLLEQSAVNFTTAAKGATSCELPYSSGESNMTISMETIDGDIVISINGDETEEGLRFRDEGITKEISNYTVNGVAASGYFSAPSLNSDKTVVTLEKIADVPENATIQFKGTIAWWSSKNTNAYVTGKTITHTYGTVCCAAGNRVKIASPVVSTTSATIAVSDACISGEGYAERLKYRRSGTSDEYTIASDPVNNVYTLSNLISATSYDVIFEAAYPSFDDQLIYEKAETSFVTEPKCSDPCWPITLTSGSSTASFRLVVMTNGDVRLIMNCEEENAMLRGNMSNYLDRFKVNGAAGSTYFNEPVMSVDQQYVTYTVKSALPDNATVGYKGSFEWKSTVNTNAYKDSEITIPYSRLSAPTVVAQETSATVTFGDALFSNEGYKYKLQYKRSVDADYTVLPVSDSNVIELTNILSGDDYDIITDIAYPSFENADRIYETTSASFSTITKCANNCTNQITDGTSTINVKMATRVNGDILITIDSDEERPRFRPEGLAVNIDLYKVNTEAASNYFNAPVMAADSSTITITKKAELPKDAVVSFDGLISWSTKVNKNAYLHGQKLSYVYNRIDITDFDVETNSATVTVSDAAFSGEGYVKRVKYRRFGTSGSYSIVTDQEAGVYQLSPLLSDTKYEVIAEAAYPSFDDPQVYEYDTISITTPAKGSEICGWQFRHGTGNTITLKMETDYPSGDLTLSIISSEPSTAVWSNEHWGGYASSFYVGEENADEYFENPVASADGKTLTYALKKVLPANATITVRDHFISWKAAPEDTENKYVNGGDQFNNFSYTYGQLCCSVGNAIKIYEKDVRSTTADLKIFDDCIYGEGFEYKLSYRVKDSGSEYEVINGRPSDGVYSLTDLTPLTDYEAKLTASYPSLASAERTEEVTLYFTTADGTSITPAPVPTQNANQVKTVYSSKFGEDAHLDWNYFTFAKSVTNEVLSSESILKKCVMYEAGAEGKEGRNGVLIRFNEGHRDLSDKLYLHFDLWISGADQLKSPYVGAKLRHEDGANTSWKHVGTLTGNEWNSFDVPLQWFVENEGLKLSEVLSMMIIPTANGATTSDGAEYSATEYTIYLDNIFFWTPVARIGSTYYNTLAEAITAAQDNQEVELLSDVTEDVTIESKTIEFDANSHSIGDLTIGLGADVTLTGDLEIGGDFTLKTGTSSTGSFDVNNKTVTLNGRALFDKKLYETGANKWYGFSLPFATDIDGITNAANGNEFTIEEDIAFNQFNSQAAADGGSKSWTHLTAENQAFNASTLYLVSLRDYKTINELRFEAITPAEAFSASTTIPLTYYTGSGSDQAKGWNGIGNNQFYTATIAADGITYGLMVDGSTYVPVTIASWTLNPGDALFLQTNADKDATLTKVGGVTKSAEEAETPAQIRIRGVGSDDYDQCFITASESASENYQIGKDLVKMAGFKNYTYATLWLNNYGTSLAAADVKTIDGEAEVSLGINAPKAGNYVISPVSMGDVETLQLTRNGEVIWDFADGDVTLALTKGENSGYALKIGVEEGVATGADEADADINAGKAVKYIENGRIIIEVNGERYNLSGIKIK